MIPPTLVRDGAARVRVSCKTNRPHDGDFIRRRPTYDFASYFGPIKYSILRKVDVEGTAISISNGSCRSAGAYSGGSTGGCVIPVFDFLRNYIANLASSFLILVILVKLVISPIPYKSYVSRAKMRLISPRSTVGQEISQARRMLCNRQQATMELYRKAGVSTLGGCIPVLNDSQMPILIALFRFFRPSIELRGQSFLWSNDLARQGACRCLAPTVDSVCRAPLRRGAVRASSRTTRR